MKLNPRIRSEIDLTGVSGGMTGDEIGSALTWSSAPITVSVAGSIITINQELKGGKRSAIWSFRHETDAGSNIDIWYIHSLNVGYTDSTGQFFVEKFIIDNSAVEVVLRDVLDSDFVGSNNHGFEEMLTPARFFVDGRQIDESETAEYKCSEFSVQMQSEIFSRRDVNTTLANVGKRWTFSGNQLSLDGNIEFQTSADMQYSYSGQLPVRKMAYLNSTITPSFDEIPMPPASTSGNNEYVKYFSAYDSLGSVSVEITTNAGSDYRGRLVNLNDSRDKFYPSHAGAGSSGTVAVTSSSVIIANSLYAISPRNESPSIFYSGNMRVRVSANSFINIDAVGLGFSVGDVLIVNAGDFDYSGNTANIDGQYYIEAITEGSTSTDFRISNENALLRSQDWSLFGSSSSSKYSVRISN